MREDKVKSFHNPYNPRKKRNRSVCNFCESNLWSKAKTSEGVTHMHTVAINHAMQY